MDFALLGPLVASAILFGVMAVGVRVAGQEMAPLQIAFFRFAGSFLVLLVATGGRDLRPKPGNLKRVLFRGMIGAAAISLYFVGIRGAGAGLAALLQSTYPVFAALLALAMLGERFTMRLGLALLLNLVGALLVVGTELQTGGATGIGMAAALASALLSAVAIVTARHLRHSENASLITTYFMAVGTLCTAPSLLAGVPSLGTTSIVAVVVVVLTSVAAQWLLHHALGFVSAAGASLVAATGVLTATVLEALWFGEAMHVDTVVGGACMIAAIGLASRGGKPLLDRAPAFERGPELARRVEAAEVRTRRAARR